MVETTLPFESTQSGLLAFALNKLSGKLLFQKLICAGVGLQFVSAGNTSSADAYSTLDLVGDHAQIDR